MSGPERCNDTGQKSSTKDPTPRLGVPTALNDKAGLLTRSFLHFYSAPKDGSKAFFRVTDPSGAGTKNYHHDPHEVLIIDIRPKLRSFSLDIHSFAPVVGLKPLQLESIDVGGHGIEVIAKSIIQSQIPDCKRIIVFDKVFRRASPMEKLCRPVRKIHIDQSSKGAWLQAQAYLDDKEYDLARQGSYRVRIVIIWRLVRAAREDHPLAFADCRSLADDDLVEVDHIFPDRRGETLAVKFNEAHKFY